MLSFFKKNKVHTYPPEIIPSLDDLMRFEYLVSTGSLLPTHPVYSILAGRHASKLRGRGLDFEEVRQYVAGDDIRNIDWRVTARTGETHSKVFNEEKERPTFILLDQSSWMFFGSQKYTKTVVAAHAAALGAFYTIKRGDRVGGLIFNEDGYDYIAPKRSKALVQYFLQCAVNRSAQMPLRKQVKNNTSLLNDMLLRCRQMVTHDYVIAIVSDFSAIDNTTKEHLRSLSNHNDVILNHVIDPLDGKLPDGKLVLSNGRRQITWQNSKKKWGKKYEDDFRKTQSELVDEFRRYRIPVVTFTTTEPVEDQVRQQMGEAMKI